MTAASKYTYCIVALAFVADAVWLALAARTPRDDAAAPDHPLRAVIFDLLLWGLIAIAIFFATNPRLWSDPFGRLVQSLRYHGDYAQSAHVRQYNLSLIHISDPTRPY